MQCFNDRLKRLLPALVFSSMLGFAPGLAAATGNLTIYQDTLSSGWDNWSWNADLSSDSNLKSSGAASLAVAYDAGWAGLSWRTGAPIDTSAYGAIRFWVYGSVGSGLLGISTQPSDDGAESTRFEFTPAPGVWSEISVPLSALGNPAQIARLTIQDRTGSVQPVYHVDNLRLIGKAAPPLRLTVDAAAARKPISPWIYGMNAYAMNAGSVAFMQELGIAVRRWGGNHTSRYNWQLDTDNRGSDWFFENVKEIGNSTPPEDSAVNRQIAQNRTAHADTLLTVPMIGFVAKDGVSCGFSIAKYGVQLAYNNKPANDAGGRSDCGNGVTQVDAGNHPTAYVSDNDPADTSLTVDAGFVQTWVDDLRARYGAANAGGVRFYGLDNEPDIWFETHRDVAPVGLSYEQLRDLTYQYAGAIKAADPTAQTLGPVVNGWTYYWFSAYDGQREDWDSPDDRNAHGGTPLVPWYLQQMRAYEQAHGLRILDYLDLHYYPQSRGVTLTTAGSAATQALRLRSTRALWDPLYVDESWIRDAGPAGGVVKLIPRMREWIAANYPGTKLAISEYNWGGLEHINGALTQADVLGIFGREGLHLATLWQPPAPTQPGAFAFRMYRNYDGAGAQFGDISIKASSNQQDKLAIYAGEEKASGALTLMIINKTAGSLNAPLVLQNFVPSGTLQGWRYSSAKLNQIVRLAERTFSGVQFTVTAPANSITLYRLVGHRPGR